MRKSKMIEFLRGHFRYSTLNSWNQSSSYACRIKINHLAWKSRELRDRACDMLEVPGAFDEFNAILADFQLSHKHAWQIACNGRSGGYLVLIQGGYNEALIAPADMKPGQRHYSDMVGRWFDYEEAKTRGWLGKTWKRVYAQPGKSFDQGEDFEGWSVSDLRDRVQFIKGFDRTCARAIKAFQDFVEHHRTEEEIIMVPEKHRVAVAI